MPTSTRRTSGRGFGCNRMNHKQSADIPLNKQQLLKAVRQAFTIQDEELRFAALDRLISQHGTEVDREAWKAAIPIIAGLFLKGGKVPPQGLLKKMREVL